jgi:hypothetical protein
LEDQTSPVDICFLQTFLSLYCTARDLSTVMNRHLCRLDRPHTFQPAAVFKLHGLEQPQAIACHFIQRCVADPGALVYPLPELSDIGQDVLAIEGAANKHDSHSHTKVSLFMQALSMWPPQAPHHWNSSWISRLPANY